MMPSKALAVVNEVRKAIVGKDAVVCKVLMAILARGHILLEDNPGVGKTTLALAFSKAMGLRYNRVQFTPEVMPADVVGFPCGTGPPGTFPTGPALCCATCSWRTRSTAPAPRPKAPCWKPWKRGKSPWTTSPAPCPSPSPSFATQNPVGSAGTQLLPESQLDRFMMRLSIGYPTLDQEVKILKQTEGARPVDSLRQVSSLEDVLQMQQEVAAVHVADDLYRYVASLCAATRQHPLIRLGASPRAGGALIRASRASAWLAGRDYIIPRGT